MSQRVLTLLALAGAAWLQWGLAAPARRATAEASTAHREARELLVEARRELGAQQRRARFLARGEAFLASAEPVSEAHRLGELRGRVVAELEGRALSDVTVQLRPHRGASDAQLFLSARGEHSEILRLPGEMVRSQPGIVLQSVSLRSDDSGLVSINLQARWTTVPAS